MTPACFQGTLMWRRAAGPSLSVRDAEFTSYVSGCADSTSRPPQERHSVLSRDRGCPRKSTPPNTNPTGRRAVAGKIDRGNGRWRILEIISALRCSTFRAEWGPCISSSAELAAACSSGPSAPRHRGGRGPGLAEATGYISIDMAQYPPSILVGRLGQVWVKCNESETTPGSKKWEKRAPLYRDVWVWLPPPPGPHAGSVYDGRSEGERVYAALCYRRYFDLFANFPYNVGREGGGGSGRVHIAIRNHQLGKRWVDSTAGKRSPL